MTPRVKFNAKIILLLWLHLLFCTKIQRCGMKRNIPNVLTVFNLFYGCQSIVSALDDDLTRAGIFIGVAAILDFFDGFVARLLKVSSETGKQLDSLADVVSFGVAPGIIFYMLSQDYLVFHESFPQFVPLIFLITYLPFLIPMFSAIRLAKFNLDTRQTDSFIGLPTPANALFIASIPFALEHTGSFAFAFFTSPWFLMIFPFVSSYLLLANIPMFSLKFKSFNWSDNMIRYIYLLLCTASVALFRWSGIGACIVLFIILSVASNLIEKNKKHEV
jgi:CDP-diacylglycerol--serine O-phosphatidyltransferase